MEYLQQDTICAIASAPGKGAIAIVRVSGEKTKEIVSVIFTPVSKSKTWAEDGYKLHYGVIKKDDELIDDVLVSVFNNPKSYTGEDSVEISCHASVYIQNEILKLLIKNGARLANPGEFTMRAYLNGKLDLSQAEAVADLLASSSAATHKLAISQMKGGYSEELKSLRANLLQFLSMLELELDFSEEEVEFADRVALKNMVVDLEKRISSLLSSFDLGNAIKEGIPVCIIGEPNVGKSTFLNAILKEEKAIVSDVPGTTRDVIEDTVVINGVTFRFMDTAGIRSTTDVVEQLGIDRTFDKIEKSDFVLLLIDVTSSLDYIKNSISEIKNRVAADKKILIIVNKTDLISKEQLEERFNKTTFSELAAEDSIIFISAKHKNNISAVTEKLVEGVNYSNISQHDAILTNMRHYEAMEKAHEAIVRVNEGIEFGLTNDLLSLELRQVLHYIGDITGEITNEEMLGNIFENFCIGK